MINFSSGSGPHSVNRIWQKVLRMFQLANIHTDILREFIVVLTKKKVHLNNRGIYFTSDNMFYRISYCTHQS